jgi:hypothetical protein
MQSEDTDISVRYIFIFPLGFPDFKGSVKAIPSKMISSGVETTRIYSICSKNTPGIGFAIPTVMII